MPGAKVEQETTPAAFSLIHHVGAGRKPSFAPMRLTAPVTYIGRTSQNDVVLTSENVSRRHAKIIVTDMGVTVHDLDSHNGIFLNGKKVRSTAMTEGDLLYVADVCLQLKRSADPEEIGQRTSITRTSSQNEEITGEEDPDARSLAVLLRATALAAVADEEAWNRQALELCRDLTEATVAVLIWQAPDGVLETPLVLQPDGARDAPVLWPLVRKALDEGVAQFSADLARKPLLDDEAVAKSGVAAVIAAPVLVDGRAEGALYLSRPMPSPLFTERELETVSAVAQLFALRRPPEAVAIESVEAQDDADGLEDKAAAEQRLREAQAEAQALTERVHALEGDALLLQQQLEAERQSAVDARREAELGRLETSKLEQGLHKNDEDAKKLKDALAKAEEERQRLKESLRLADEERREVTVELERLRDAFKAQEQEREALRAEIAEHVRTSQDRDDELQRIAAELERAQAQRNVAEDAKAAAYDALRATMRSVVPTSVAEHIEAGAEGGSLVTDVAVRPVAALFSSLRGFDSWAAHADPALVKRRLDHFCNSVALRARANGGRVEQVLGHSHLVLFPADAASVRAAVRCGVEIASLVPNEDNVGVVSALHVAPSVAGFFGEGDAATRVEAGEAVLVSRCVALMLAHEPAFYVSDAVQRLVGSDPAFTLAILGPSALVGAPAVMLFKVMADSMHAPMQASVPGDGRSP